MSRNLMISLLRKGNTGDQLLGILDAIAGGFKYIESPMIEQVLGIATLEPLEF